MHATGEPGTGYAVAAGVASVDHAYQLSEATMRAMKEKGIYAVPTFAIAEYFAEHAATPERAAREKGGAGVSCGGVQEAAGCGCADGGGERCGAVSAWDAGSGAGVDGREYGMKPAEVLQADLINGAKLLGWGGQIGELKAGYFADVIAVPGNPLEDISVTTKVAFVMKNGVIYKRP